MKLKRTDDVPKSSTERLIIAQRRMMSGFLFKDSHASLVIGLVRKMNAWSNTTGIPIEIHALSMYSSSLGLCPLWYHFASCKYDLHKSVH